MCRYAFKTYKAHFACFHCRKTFKKTALDDYVEHIGLGAAYKALVANYRSNAKRQEVELQFGITYQEIEARYLADVSTCPQCAQAMAAMGLDFKSPSSDDEEAWDIVSTLYTNGFAFQGCGCTVGYRPPQRRSALPGWLKQHARRSEGEKLLLRIASRNG